MSDLKLLGLSGSLRAGSLNTALLRAAGELAPAGVALTVHDYRDIPLYDDDLDEPEGVARLKAALAEADGVLLAVPEYNHSMSGVLKNALDWVSRPAYRSVFRDKPTGVVSAAASLVGGARGQQHAKTILLGMGTPVFPWPELLVGGAGQRFTDGRLTDDKTAGFVREFMAGFAAWVARTRG